MAQPITVNGLLAQLNAIAQAGGGDLLVLLDINNGLDLSDNFSLADYYVKSIVVAKGGITLIVPLHRIVLPKRPKKCYSCTR